MLRLAIRAPRRVDQVAVLVHDPDPSDICAEFLVDAGVITTVRLAGAGSLDFGVIRDLPLAGWGKAAAVVATWLADEPDVAARVRAAEPGALVELTTADVKRARSRHIGSHDQRTVAVWSPAAARSAASRHRLATVAADHAVRVIAGSRDPAGDLARKYQCPANSVRTWLHRARLQGLDPTRPKQTNDNSEE